MTTFSSYSKVTSAPASSTAAIESGTFVVSLEVEALEPLYEPLRQDELLGGLWNEAMIERGRPLAGSTGVMAASTDMGNVSQHVPSLHPFVGITGVDAALHTVDTPLNELNEDALIPGAAALERINASLR